MASRWLFRPLPLRERVGRGVAPVSSTLRTRRLVVPSPPHPDPLPRGEREPEVLSTKGVIANSTVLRFGTMPEANGNQPQIIWPQMVYVRLIRPFLCKTKPIPGRSKTGH